MDLFTRPVVVRVPDLLVRQYGALLRDLSLTSERLADQSTFWRLSSWLDTPLVYVNGAYWCPSNILQAVFKEGHDDHMLRLAALVDAQQYSRVSQAREARMRDLCVTTLEENGWECTAPLELTNPAADIDIYATREQMTIILELKSTLRPESPREVASRNDELHLGLRKSEERQARFALGTIAAVVTDGYRGDYRTWADALKRKVVVVTVDELGSFAADPSAYLDGLLHWTAARPVGGSPLPDREANLLGWRMIVRDEP